MSQIQITLADGQKIDFDGVKRLITDKKNFLVRFQYRQSGQKLGKSLIFYIDSTLKVRLVNEKEKRHVPAEIKKGGNHPFLDYKEWTWACGIMKETEISEEEILLISEMAKNILDNPLFGFPEDIVSGLKTDMKKSAKNKGERKFKTPEELFAVLGGGK